MIGKGVIKTDDYIRFGKMIDSIAKDCYTITISCKKEQLIICCHRDKLPLILEKLGKKEGEVEVKGRGGLRWIKMKI